MREALQHIKTILRIFGVLALGVLLFCGWSLLEKRKPESEAELIFLGGEGESAVLLSRGSCVVMDAGNEEGGAGILRLLKERGIEQIDCLILSSPANRHIGGADDLLGEVEIRQILIPYYEGGSETFRSLKDQARLMRIPMYPIYRHRLFRYGELDIRVFAPEKFYYDEQKNYTLAVSFRHGEVRGFILHGGGGERIREVLRMPLESVYLCRLSEKIKEEGRAALLGKLAPQIDAGRGEGEERFVSDAKEIRKQEGETR